MSLVTEQFIKTLETCECAFCGVCMSIHSVDVVA